jgi:hypothetical protein
MDSACARFAARYAMRQPMPTIRESAAVSDAWDALIATT